MRYTTTLVLLLLLFVSACRLIEPEDEPKERFFRGIVTDPDGEALDGAQIHIVFDDPSFDGGKDDPPELGVTFYVLQTPDNYAQVSWCPDALLVEAFEVWRSYTNDHTQAVRISGLIPGNPTPGCYIYDYIDTEIELGEHYFYFITMKINGDWHVYGPHHFVAMLPEPGSLPTTWALDTPHAIMRYHKGFRFALPTAARVRLDVYDPFMDRSFPISTYSPNLSAGYHYDYWDGKDPQGNDLPNGHYELRLMVQDSFGQYEQRASMALLKNRITPGNQPIAYSHDGSFQLSYQNYFGFGSQIGIYDHLAQVQHQYQMQRRFRIHVRKAGYLESVREVSIPSLKQDFLQSFVLFPID